MVLEPSFGLVGNPLRLVSYDPEFQFQALPKDDDEQGFAEGDPVQFNSDGQLLAELTSRECFRLKYNPLAVKYIAVI